MPHQIENILTEAAFIGTVAAALMFLRRLSLVCTCDHASAAVQQKHVVQGRTGVAAGLLRFGLTGRSRQEQEQRGYQTEQSLHSHTLTFPRR